jgi:hypothetical protein
MVVVEDLKRRDYVAIEAMKSIIQGCSNMGVVNYDPKTLARSAYKMADEMFAASMGIVDREESPEEVTDCSIREEKVVDKESVSGKGWVSIDTDYWSSLTEEEKREEELKQRKSIAKAYMLREAEKIAAAEYAKKAKSIRLGGAKLDSPAGGAFGAAEMAKEGRPVFFTASSSYPEVMIKPTKI